MELSWNYLVTFIENGSILFGTVAGTIYSIIGITLSSLLFYGIILWMPQTFKKFVNGKQKLIGNHSTFTIPQITLIRLIPFIHFNLLSICLMEISIDFKDYVKASLFTSLPFVIVYTSLGKSISNLSYLYTLPLLIGLLFFIYK